VSVRTYALAVWEFLLCSDTRSTWHQKKGTTTTNKPLDNSTWTYDEGEEICKDISDLQEDTITKDELEAMGRRMMDSQRGHLKGLEDEMKDLKEGLQKLLQDKLSQMI